MQAVRPPSRRQGSAASARGTGAAGLGIFNSAGGDRPHSRRTDDNTPNLGQPNEFVAGSGSRAVALLKPGAPSRSRHTDDLSPEPADLAAQLEAEKIKNKLLADALDAERKKSRTLEDQVRALQARLQTDPGPSPINISISPTRQIPETVQAPAPAGDDFGPDTMKKLDALSIKTEEVAKDETPEGKRKGTFRKRRLTVSNDEVGPAPGQLEPAPSQSTKQTPRPDVSVQPVTPEPWKSGDGPSPPRVPSPSAGSGTPRKAVRKRRYSASRLSGELGEKVVQLVHGGSVDVVPSVGTKDLAEHAFDTKMVGTFSCHGQEPVGDNDKIAAKINQDCASVTVIGAEEGADPAAAAAEGGGVLICVLDGHGPCGEYVSQHAMRTLQTEIAKSIPLGRSSPTPLSQPAANSPFKPTNTRAASLTAAFETAQKALVVATSKEELLDPDSSRPVDASHSGACAIAVLLDTDPAADKSSSTARLTIAHSGDCRAVIGTSALPAAESPTDVVGGPIADEKADTGKLRARELSEDHRPDAPEEKARIEAHGGWVRPQRGVRNSQGGEDFYPARVYASKANPRKGPGLCMSRSLGDLDGVSCGLIATPEVHTHSVDAATDQFIIVASDGVWEFLTAEDAVTIVQGAKAQGKDANSACQSLILKAALAWREHEGDYRDDITAVVAYLPQLMKGLSE